MNAKDVTPQKVLDKLIELQKIQAKSKRGYEAIGVDTLAILFNSSITEMMEVLQRLEAFEEITLFERTPGRKTAGKSNVWFVSLRK